MVVAVVKEQEWSCAETKDVIMCYVFSFMFINSSFASSYSSFKQSMVAVIIEAKVQLLFTISKWDSSESSISPLVIVVKDTIVRKTTGGRAKGEGETRKAAISGGAGRLKTRRS